MKAYIRTDPLIDERKGHYTPAQLGTYLMVLCKAARQAKRGRFRSQQALKNMVPAAYARHLSFLYDEGDLVTDDDGMVYVDGWDEWQEGDLTVGERMARMRNRKRNATVTPPVTEPYQTATSTLDVDTDVDVQKERSSPSPQPPDAFEAYYRVTIRYATGNAAKWLSRLIDEYGEEKVERALVEAGDANPDSSKLLGNVEGLLTQRAFRAAKEADARRKAADARYEADLKARIDNATPEEKARAEQIKAGIGDFIKGAAS